MKQKFEVDEKKIEAISQTVIATEEQVMSLKIIDERTMGEAGNLLTQLNKHADTVKKDKESLTKPLNAVLSNIRKRYKPVETKLETAIKYLRKEIGAYQLLQEEKAEADRLAIASRVGEGRGKLKVETAVAKMAEVEGPETKRATEGGSVSFKDDHEITVVDIRKIPEKFLEVDIAGIKKVFNAGGTVEGVVAKKVKTVINRRN